MLLFHIYLQSCTEPLILSFHRHILCALVRVFGLRAQLLPQPTKSEIWAEEVQPEKETKAALMRGQRLFWVKYSAVVYMISMVPRERRNKRETRMLV